MSKISALGGPDVQYVRDIIRRFYAGPDPVNSTDVTKLATEELRRRARSGDAHADRILDGLEEDGVRAHVKVVEKEDTCDITLASGKKIRIPVRMAILPTAEDGTKERWHSRPFWEYTWAEFEEAMQNRVAMRDRFSDEVEALRLVADLRVLCPDSLTPGEACDRLGLDRRHFAAV